MTPQTSSSFAAALSAARSPNDIRELLKPRSVHPPRWHEVGQKARVFDSALIDSIAAVPGGVVALAQNQWLKGHHLQRAVLHAVRLRGCMRAVSLNRGAPDDALELFARRGSLARYPFLLRQFLGGIMTPHYGMRDFPGLWRRAADLVLNCPVLPEDVMLAFDARLVRLGMLDGDLRVELAKHPSAPVALWHAMLQAKAGKCVRKAIASIPRAQADAGVRYWLGEKVE